jgi:hypothetical protein
MTRLILNSVGAALAIGLTLVWVVALFGRLDVETCGGLTLTSDPLLWEGASLRVRCPAAVAP